MDITGIGSILDFGGKLIDRIWPDPAAAQAAKLKMLEMSQQGELAELAASWENAKAQLTVNAAEAENPNFFVSGWRPAIGWVCGAAFAYKFIIAPVMLFAFAAAGSPVGIPTLDYTEMMPVLFGMLGLGAMRSYDKEKGTSR